jgi:anti-sigma regulatory factor (Ser/Thr protein kinase)/CheY-like chemotaxis protein
MGSAESFEPVASVLVLGPTVDVDALLPDGVRSRIDYAETAAQAISCLAEQRYDFVLVNHTAEGDLTHQQMAYLRAAQAAAAGTKFILLVSHTTTRKVIESLRHGMFAYFSRPFDPSAVKEAIRRALALPAWSNGIEVVSAAPDYISVRLRCRVDTADRLTLFMKELPCELPDDERSRLSMAFREMLLNAIEHGGKLNPDEWVTVSRVHTQRTIVYHVHDPGEGFSRTNLAHAAIANPPDRPMAHMDIRTTQEMRAGGFGMLIANQLVDEVIYNQKGNEVILIKHLD